jgi:hypothetical protein
MVKKENYELYRKILGDNEFCNYDMDKPRPDKMHNLFEWLNREEIGGLYNPFVTNDRYFVICEISNPSWLLEATKFFELLGFDPQNVTIYENGASGMPSVKNLLSTLSEIAKKADNNDFLFLQVGGHNYNDRRPGSFGVMLADGGASYQYEINPHLDNIKAKAKVVFIDTCASGVALEYNTSKNTIFLTQVGLDDTAYGFRLLERAIESVTGYYTGYTNLPPLRKYVSMKDVLEYARAHPTTHPINAQISDPFGLAEKVYFGSFVQLDEIYK